MTPPGSGSASGEPVPPAYGRGSLAELLPAIGAHLGVPGLRDVLDLGPLLGDARQVCVLLIDGLGDAVLRRRAADAPYLTSLPGRTLTCGFPSSTPISLTSLATGLPPGAHGMLGIGLALPGSVPARIFSTLTWDDSVDPLAWQPHPTVFELAAVADVEVVQVSRGSYEGSGLNRASMRGGRYVPAETPGDVVARAAAEMTAAATARRPALVYTYQSDLDATGHLRGPSSESWRHQLAQIDLLASRLAAASPPGSALVVTADHGQIDVDPAGRVDVEGDPALAAGVEAVGGDGRARHVYTAAGATSDVLAAWSAVLGDRAWVRGRDDAVAAGWFGPSVSPTLLPRIGDVVAAARSRSALVLPRTAAVEAGFAGMHGSLTDDEQIIPLLVGRGGSPGGSWGGSPGGSWGGSPGGSWGGSPGGS